MTVARNAAASTWQVSDARKPVAFLLVPVITLTLAAQAVSLLNGWNVMPAKIFEIVLLLGGAIWFTAARTGRAGVRGLFAGLTRWRIGVPYALLVLVALPLATVAVAALTGTLSQPKDGVGQVVLFYLLALAFGAVTANLWEELVWAGLVQAPLMARNGILRSALLTAVPFFVIHLPLAFEEKGWPGTSWREAFITWAILFVSAPFFRWLVGVVLLGTRASLLAVGLLHASFNAAGALPIYSGGWQYVPAMIALTVVVALVRRRRGRSAAGEAARGLDVDQPGPESRGA